MNQAIKMTYCTVTNCIRSSKLSKAADVLVMAQRSRFSNLDDIVLGMIRADGLDDLAAALTGEVIARSQGAPI